MGLKEILREKMQRLVYSCAVAAGPGECGLTGASQSPVQQLFGATSLPELFNAAFQTAIVIGAMLAVARLVYAGFLYMTTDLPGSKGNAKTIIGEATLGLLLLLAVWIILYQINPQILNLNILQGVTPAERTTLPPPSCPTGQVRNAEGNCAVPTNAVPTDQTFSTPDGTLQRFTCSMRMVQQGTCVPATGAGICGQSPTMTQSWLCGFSTMDSCVAQAAGNAGRCRSF